MLIHNILCSQPVSLLFTRCDQQRISPF